MAETKKDAGAGTPRKYVPETEGLNRQFFQACAAGVVHLQRCNGCGAYRHPPRYYCPQCFSDGWSWQPVSGAGKVASWVTTHFSVDRAWAEEAPYTTIVVELDEGPRLLGAMRGLTEADLEPGLPVQLIGEAKGEDFVFFWVDRIDSRQSS
jgi:uncharacterized OB-fold protein